MALGGDNQRKEEKSGLDDGHGDGGEGLLGDSLMMLDGDDEPGWFQFHRVFHHTFGVLG